MKNALRLVALTVLALGLLTGGTALAQTQAGLNPGDRVSNMEKLFDSPKAATHSDFAFWGKYAVLGYYTGSIGGARIFDISNPASPSLVRDFPCNGNQNDPIFYDRNGNDVPDLMLLAVDRTMDTDACSSPVSNRVNAEGETVRFDANPTGWEGVRVFSVSDGSADFPGAPFTNITQVDAQYTDCGAHTITANTKFANDAVNPRLVVYVESYPLRPGPTCGVTGSLTAQRPHENTTNPFEESDREVEDPLHGVIQVLSVPLNDPAATVEIAEPEIRYPGDPDGKLDWTERGLTGLEPAAVACHDVVIHVPDNIAGGACGEQGQVWEVDPNTGIPNTTNPMAVGDDEFSSGGTGQFPGAVDFFHSVMFDNGMETVNWVDESFGSGCPPLTKWQKRPWHKQRTHQTGYMYFSDMEGEFQSRFHVGDLRPDKRKGEYCSAHMGMTVTGIEEDLLVNAWYTGGVDVIDFTDPENLEEIAYFDMERQTGSWSAYPYTGPLFNSGGGVPVYVSDGVELNALARGMEVYRANITTPGAGALLDHLNPQTMEE
jgi:hypothetical protein